MKDIVTYSTMTWTRGALLMLLMLLSLSVWAQKERSLLRKGNKAYEDGDYTSAESLYREALEADGSYGKAAFNLGNSLYQKGNLGQASSEYEKAAADAIAKEDKAKAFHNVGNAFLNAARMLMENPPPPNDTVQAPDPQQLIRASIEAFKKSLRNDPSDDETRYNLAYAQKLLDKNGGGGGQDQQEQQQDDQGENEQEQDQQDKGDQGEQDQDERDQDGDKGQQEEQQDQESQPNEMSREEAEQLLKALDQNEKDLQEKLGKERVQGERMKIEKDW